MGWDTEMVIMCDLFFKWKFNRLATPFVECHLTQGSLNRTRQLIWVFTPDIYYTTQTLIASLSFPSQFPHTFETETGLRDGWPYFPK